MHLSLSDCRVFTSVVSAVCQENASSVYVVAKRVQSLWQRVRLGVQHGLVEEVRTKRDRCAGGGGLRAFPRGERATTERVPLPSACVPARSLTRFW